ncbi:hypothetical protein LINPERPRIM_LOCUS25332 [Linum perenne]
MSIPCTLVSKVGDDFLFYVRHALIVSPQCQNHCLPRLL